MNFSISILAKKFNLSRSTLIYYNKLGLLVPSTRSKSNYRVYSEGDYQRLKQICILRDTGISLDEIKNILETSKSHTAKVLKNRLENINNEINTLRMQQNQIIKMLGQQDLLVNTKVMTKEKWVEILRASGLNEDGMTKWHHEFEISRLH